MFSEAEPYKFSGEATKSPHSNRRTPVCSKSGTLQSSINSESHPQSHRSGMSMVILTVSPQLSISVVYYTTYEIVQYYSTTVFRRIPLEGYGTKCTKVTVRTEL